MQPIQQAFEPDFHMLCKCGQLCTLSESCLIPCYVTVTGSEAMILLFYIREFQENIRERY